MALELLQDGDRGDGELSLRDMLFIEAGRLASLGLYDDPRGLLFTRWIPDVEQDIPDQYIPIIVLPDTSATPRTLARLAGIHLDLEDLRFYREEDTWFLHTIINLKFIRLEYPHQDLDVEILLRRLAHSDVGPARFQDVLYFALNAPEMLREELRIHPIVAAGSSMRVQGTFFERSPVFYVDSNDEMHMSIIPQSATEWSGGGVPAKPITFATVAHTGAR